MMMMMAIATYLLTIILTLLLLLPTETTSFQLTSSSSIFNNVRSQHQIHNIPSSSSSSLYGNIYDEWRSDLTIVDSLPLEEEYIQMCLDEIIYSNYGEQMFGIHDRAGTCTLTLSSFFFFLFFSLMY